MGVLKCIAMDCGLKCVITDCMYLEYKPKLFVENWDFLDMIIIGSLGDPEGKHQPGYLEIFCLELEDPVTAHTMAGGS